MFAILRGMPQVVYYSNARGEEPVREYVEGLHRTGQRAALASFERCVDLLIEHGPALGMPYARIIDRRNRVYELRFGAHRAAFALHGEEVVLLRAWRKQSQKLDKAEADRALANLADWIGRHQESR